jgi:hypothetical protein
MRKFNIPRRNRSESLTGELNSFFGKTHSKESLEKMRKAKKGKILSTEHKQKISEGLKGLFENEKNPNWKGNDVSYTALHDWIRKHLPKQKICDICKKSGRLELSNRDHKYSRNLDDWQWVHAKCHYKYDKERGLRK